MMRVYANNVVASVSKPGASPPRKLTWTSARVHSVQTRIVAGYPTLPGSFPILHASFTFQRCDVLATSDGLRRVPCKTIVPRRPVLLASSDGLRRVPCKRKTIVPRRHGAAHHYEARIEHWRVDELPDQVDLEHDGDEQREEQRDLVDKQINRRDALDNNRC